MCILNNLLSLGRRVDYAAICLDPRTRTIDKNGQRVGEYSCTATLFLGGINDCHTTCTLFERHRRLVRLSTSSISSIGLIEVVMLVTRPESLSKTTQN
jgi:hypothetical protein